MEIAVDCLAESAESWDPVDEQLGDAVVDQGVGDPRLLGLHPHPRP